MMLNGVVEDRYAQLTSITTKRRHTTKLYFTTTRSNLCNYTNRDEAAITSTDDVSPSLLFEEFVPESRAFISFEAST